MNAPRPLRDAEPGPTPAPTSTAAPSSSAIPPGAIVLLSLAAFASSSSLRVVDPLLPHLAELFSVSLSRASWLIAAFSVAYGISQLVFGPLGDRYGKFRVVAWACVASAFTSAACGLSSSYGSLFATRLLAGATAAAVIPLSMAWIGDVVPYEHRQPVIARFLIGQIFGISAGMLIGGLAADHLGWRTPFFLTALTFAGISVALLSLDKRLPDFARRTVVAPGSAARRLVHEFAAVLKMPWARVVLVAVFLEGFFLFGPYAFVAAYLHGRFGLSLGAAGAVLMLFGAGGLLFAMRSRAIVQRLGETGLSAWGAGLMGASLLLTAWTPAWWLSLPACFVTGLGFYMLHNTLQTNATQMAPERRGAAVAAFASLLFLGQSLGVSAAGALVAVTDVRWALTAGALGVLAVGTTFARLRQRSPHAPR